VNKSLLRANKEYLDAEPPESMGCEITDIYDRHIDTVYRVCFSMMGNKQDAEDAVQAVFIKLMEVNRQFADYEHEKAWLITAARNHCRDLHRKWWRKKVVDLDVSVIDRAGQAADRDTIFGGGSMTDYLRKLSWIHRIVLYLYYYEGYKVAEIATILEMNINTVKSQMRNARKKLKLEIGDDFHE